MKKYGKKVPYGVVRRYGRAAGKRAAGLLGYGVGAGVSSAARVFTGGLVDFQGAARYGYKKGRQFYKWAFPRMRYARIASNKTARQTGSNRGPVLGSNPDPGVPSSHKYIRPGLNRRFGKTAHSRFIRY